MSLRVLAALVLLLLPLLAPAVGAADPCALGAAGRRKVSDYYVEHRADNDVWVYEETNGIPNLQRGGTNDFGDRDRCVDDPLVVPDAIFL